MRDFRAFMVRAAAERLNVGTLTEIVDDLCGDDFLQQMLLDGMIAPNEAAQLIFDSLEESAVSAIKRFRRAKESDFSSRLRRGWYRRLGRDEPEVNHITIEALNDYWFQHPMQGEERRLVEAHLAQCVACQKRVARFQQVFPDRKDPDRK